jgi:dephospho-CoA kinase
VSQIIIGLTGGIGSGKTTIANMFATLGIDIIDADIIAREVVQPNSPGLTLIKQHFGDKFILDDGNLNRALLREKIFSCEHEKKWLNDLLHPLIRQSITSQLELATSPYCLLVAPLLIENKLDALVHKILVIDVTESVQLARTLKRDKSNEQVIKSIMASQLSRTDRLSAADDVINNNDECNQALNKVGTSCSKSELYNQVEELHQKYLQLNKSLFKRNPQ